MEYTFRGRKWSITEIEIIKRIIGQETTRRKISKRVCEDINWRQANGQLKDAACREVLRRMDERGIINLPPLIRRSSGGRGIRPREKWRDTFPEENIPAEGDIQDLGKINLKVANKGTLRNLWEYLIDKYHYLGYRRPIGASVKYLIYSSERLIGCIGFAASVLKLNLRDKWIGWSIEEREKNLHLVINNVRFLILPWVKVKNLATKLLSMASKDVQKDWEAFYGYRPVLIETFVDIGKFIGTSYKAANWIYLGRTIGKGRTGMNYYVHNRPKDVYAYPLRRNFLRLLKCRE